MIHSFSTAAMRRRMDRFERWDARSEKRVGKDPPKDYAEVLLESCGYWGFPFLHSISRRRPCAMTARFCRRPPMTPKAR
jgi:hypothetical protein